MLLDLRGRVRRFLDSSTSQPEVLACLNDRPTSTQTATTSLGITASPRKCLRPATFALSGSHANGAIEANDFAVEHGVGDNVLDKRPVFRRVAEPTRVRHLVAQ